MGEPDRRMVRKAGIAGTALAIAVLVALTPAFACTAKDGLLSVSPGKADPGAPVTIVGEAFKETGTDAGPVTIRWNGPNGVPIGTTNADAQGTFRVDVVVPADAAPGFYPVNATQWLADGEAYKPSVTVQVLGEPIAAAPEPAAAQPAAPEPVPAPVVEAPVQAQAAPVTAAPATTAPVRRAATRTPPSAASPAAQTTQAPPVPVASVEADPAPAEVAPAVAAPVPPPVVDPGAVTADLWSGFGTLRSPTWAGSRDAAPSSAGSDDASQLWLVPVIGGLALIGLGAFGLVRRPKAAAGQSTSAD